MMQPRHQANVDLTISTRIFQPTSPTPFEMWQPKPTLLLLLLLLAVSLRACTAEPGGKPLVTAVTKDPTTSLYTAPLDNGHPLVLNLSASAITSPCSSGGGGGQKKTRVLNLSANATDGRNPLYPVSFPAAASCAPPGAAGVAGLGRSDLSLPAQVASTQKVANTFALCLPRDGSVGVAIFGGGPIHLLPRGSSYRPAATTFLSGEVPLKWTTVFGSGPQGRYEASITEENGIAVGGELVDFAGPGHGRFPIDVGLSTTAPYTELRGGVYRDVADAFDRAMGRGARVDPPPGAPFELCYDSRKLPRSPQVDLMLEGGQNWTDVGLGSMKQVDENTACFAFVEMKQTSGMPAVVIGGFQMEDRLVVFDEERRVLRFTGPLPARRLSCSDFNFTMAAGGGGGDPWSVVESI